MKCLEKAIRDKIKEIMKDEKFLDKQVDRAIGRIILKRKKENDEL